MKTATIALSTLLLASVGGATACGSDPNKQAKQAQAEQVEANREQAEKRIEEQKKAQVNAIEKGAEQSQEQAGSLPEGAEQRAKAQSDIMARRQTFQAEAQARLQKANVRVLEMRRKLDIAPGQVPLETRDKVDLATRAVEAGSAGLSRLPQVSNERWANEEKHVNARLDEIDRLVDDAASDVDKRMP